MDAYLRDALLAAHFVRLVQQLVSVASRLGIVGGYVRVDG